MTEFLKTVANHYMLKAVEEASKTGEPASLPLSRYVFCFPNHRSSLFFSRYLHESFNGPCCVPSTITIEELFGLFSKRCIADRTTLLFRLYDIYRKLSLRTDKEEFDQFVFWGDMLLADFDDIDKYLVPADRLFSNVRDLKEIEAAFAGFEPEIIEVIQSFWHNYKPVNTAEDGKREAFSQTWSILKDLYILFKRCLAKDNLAYAGMMEREVVEQEDLNFNQLNYDKVVFVGLTAINKAERNLMSRLLLDKRAEFCWDYADPLLSDPKSPMSSASFFTAKNLNDFPNELSRQELQAGLIDDKQRKYSLYSVSSGVGQTQVARNILQAWKRTIKDFDPFRTAVILPDEHLLVPMLYAVPTEFESFNVTMGYGLKDTPVAAFVQNLASLQESCRQREGHSDTFYYKQVLPLLHHNYTTAIVGNAAHLLSKAITERNLYQVPVSEFVTDSFLSKIFRRVTSAEDTICYLQDILEEIMSHADLFTETDYEFLYHYRATVEKLGVSVKEQTFEFTPKTLFLLLSKLIHGVSVPFQGEPLHGLQIMGVLETRALDFDNIIFLSMNEGVFPAKPSNNTFVPMSLRNAFDMPTQKHRDAVFAYHFYRLISRASNVVMVYDSRTDGMQTGEESRYVKQIRFLLDHEKELEPRIMHNNISIPSRVSIKVKKTPEMLDNLRKSIAPGARSALSASSLKDFIKCPLRFYLGFVRHLKEDQDVNEGVDQRTFGDILHHAICQLYSRCEGKRIDSGLYKDYIEHPDREVTRAIMDGFKEVMHIDNVEGYNLLISRILIQYIVETLRHDSKLGVMEYVAGEKKHKFPYRVNDDLEIQVTCIFDRIDKTFNNGETVRIVDYKTGSSQHTGKLNFPEVEQLFTPDGKGSSEAFQVMLYCLILSRAKVEDLKKVNLSKIPERLVPHLYFVRDFKASTNVSTSLSYGSGKTKTIIDDFAPYEDEFEVHFKKLIERIFDPNEPFGQCEDEHHCSFCAFKSYCMRN